MDDEEVRLTSATDAFNTSSHELEHDSAALTNPQLRLVLRLVGFETVEGHTVFYLYVCDETLSGRTWFVRKRYSQFEALRSAMKAQLSRTVKVPPLPGKRLFNNMDPEFVRERARGLSTFVWSLAGNPMLCRLPCVQKFLWADVEGAEAPKHMQPTTPFLRSTSFSLTFPAPTEPRAFALDGGGGGAITPPLQQAHRHSGEAARLSIGDSAEALKAQFALEGLDLAEQDSRHDSAEDSAYCHWPAFLQRRRKPVSPQPSPHGSPSKPSPLDDAPPPRRTPMPALRVVIILVGSRGDVQPYVALGKALKAKGHVVRIAAHEVFRTWIKGQHGLDFAPIAGDPKELLKMVVENQMFSYAFVKNGFDKHRPWVSRVLHDAWVACTQEDPDHPRFPVPTANATRKVGPGHAFAQLESSFRADLVICNPPSFAGWHVAEALGVPLCMSFPMPWSRTGEFPSPFTSVSSTPSKSLNWLSFGAVDRLIWLGVGDLVNAWRTSELWLPPIWTMSAKGHRYVHDYKVPWLYPWSAAVLPKPKDWGAHIDVCGAWALEDSDGSDWRSSAELDAFLAFAPVFIGFGSIVVPDPERLSSIIQQCADLLVASGRRVLVQPGWAGIQVNPSPGVMVIGPAPHKIIFARCSAVVHHGGSGTTAEGLRCGKPTVIVPFFGDQFFWGDTVKARGLGDTVAYSSLTETRLFEAVLVALNPDNRVRCELCRDAMAREDGVARAIEFIERAVFPPCDGHHITDAPLPRKGDQPRRVHDNASDWRFWPFYNLKEKVKVERWENPSGFRKVKGRVRLFLSPASALDLSSAAAAAAGDDDGVEMQDLALAVSTSAAVPPGAAPKPESAALYEGATSPRSMSNVPVGHSRFSWVSGAHAAVPMGHTPYSWGV